MEITLIVALLAGVGVVLIFLADRHSTSSLTQSWRRRILHRKVNQQAAGFQAVSIETGDGEACSKAKALGNTRFLTAEAPSIPMAGCDQSLECHCHYVHHEDRRQNGPDRRQRPDRRFGIRDDDSDRRQLGGRRRSDWRPLAA